MLVNYGYGHNRFSVVPYHPDCMEDLWVVMLSPRTPFHIGPVHKGREAADTFAEKARKNDEEAKGRSLDSFIEVPNGSRVKIKGYLIRADENDLPYLKVFGPGKNDGREGVAQASDDHSVTVLFDGDTSPYRYSKRDLWILD